MSVPFPHVPVEWDTNLRDVPRLWPDVSPAVRSLARLRDRQYHERKFMQDWEGRATDERAVRRAVEVSGYLGLFFRDEEDVFRLTDLAENVLEFLGVVGGRQYANENNIGLVGDLIARGVAGYACVQAIWLLMRHCGNRLTNEELNRCTARVRYLGDVSDAAAAVAAAREANDPTLVGPRRYKDEDYGTDREADQRKFAVPQFVWAGAGGCIISVDSATPFRSLVPGSVETIDELLVGLEPQLQPEPRQARQTPVVVSMAAGVPPDLRRVSGLD